MVDQTLGQMCPASGSGWCQTDPRHKPVWLLDLVITRGQVLVFLALCSSPCSPDSRDKNAAVDVYSSEHGVSSEPVERKR